jgi:hypothetical protein
MLLDHHRANLHASGISDEVIEAARITSVTHWRQLLGDCGFKEGQARALHIGTESPAMIFPAFGVAGLEPVYARVRLDNPKGDQPRYVQPAGMRLSLYVPPMCQGRVNTCCAKYVTEGEKKALALATLGECAISIPGVTGFRGRNKHGALTRLPDWEEVGLNDSRIHICFDSDTVDKVQVAEMLVRLHGWIQRTRRGFPFILIPPRIDGQAKTGIDDYIASGKTLLDVAALARSDVPDLAEIRRQQELSKRDPNGPPVIETNGIQLKVMAAAAMDALNKQNSADPRLFIRGGRMVHVCCDEHDRASARELRVDGLRHYLERCAEFRSTSEKRGAVAVFPPATVCEDILVKPDIYGLPALAGITTAPTFAPDGTLLDKPGYQPLTRAYYRPSDGFVLPDTTPTPENVAASLSLLVDDLLVDFPMVDKASTAHALALILLPFVRSMICGPTPLHIIDAPTAGTGKTKLATACMIPFLGRIVDARPAPAKPEEWDKTLFAALVGGSPAVLIDNARRLDSSTLELILTAPDTYTSRVLGASEERTFAVRQVWMATANNVVMVGDLPRRCVWIRIDAGVERPEERPTFKHDPLEAWAMKEHPRLAGACVTIVRSWIDAGMPAYSGKRKGSYEAWCAVMGGILQHHHIDGFLSNTDAALEHMDTRPAMWKAFLQDWYSRYEDSPKGVSDVQEIALQYLADEIGDRDTPRAVSTRIGALIRAQVDRVFGDLKLKQDGKKQGAAQYLVFKALHACEPIEPSEPCIPYAREYHETRMDTNTDTLGIKEYEVPKVPEVHGPSSPTVPDWTRNRPNPYPVAPRVRPSHRTPALEVGVIE